MTTTEEGGFGMSRTPGAILLSGVGGARSNPPRTDGNSAGAAQLSDHNQPAVTAPYPGKTVTARRSTV